MSIFSPIIQDKSLTNELLHNAQPIAQVYAGHQFGNFVPHLGDGRALLLGELLDRQGNRHDLALSIHGLLSSRDGLQFDGSRRTLRLRQPTIRRDLEPRQIRRNTLAANGKGKRKNILEEATTVLETFMPAFQRHWYLGATAKLGLANPDKPGNINDSERSLVDDWLELLTKNEVDYTLAWRKLAEKPDGTMSKLAPLFTEHDQLNAWLKPWRRLHNGVPASQIASAIRAANRLYIPHNHLVEEALAAASENADLAPFESLLEVVQQPFDEKPECTRYAMPATT